MNGRVLFREKIDAAYGDLDPDVARRVLFDNAAELYSIAAPPAVINAITDAIGNNDLTMPATPQKVWAALNAKQ